MLNEKWSKLFPVKISESIGPCKESKETPYTVHNRLINLEYQTVVITDKFSSGGDCNSYKEDDYSATMKVNAF